MRGRVAEGGTGVGCNDDKEGTDAASQLLSPGSHNLYPYRQSNLYLYIVQKPPQVLLLALAVAECGPEVQEGVEQGRAGLS